MSDSDKKTKDGNDCKKKVVIDLEEVDSDYKDTSNQVDSVASEKISEAAKKMAKGYLSFNNHTERLSSAYQQAFNSIHTFNASQVSDAIASFSKSYESYASLLDGVATTQATYINEALNAINQINFEKVFNNYNHTLSKFQEVIIPMIMEDTHNVLERLSEIDFSDVTFDDEDINQIVEVVEDDGSL